LEPVRLNGRLLDTNVLIDLISARSPRLDARYAAELLQATPLFLSAISIFEFRFGAERSRRREFQLLALERFLAGVAVIEFDDRDARAAAILKSTLAARGTPIGAYDLLIAAQAMARNLGVVTANGREFSRAPGLVIEDWTTAP
jgi:tRNA(fMet)-specific endonuclease VapC